LHDRRAIVIFQRPDDAEGKPQSLFRALVWRGPVYPSVERPHILDSGDVGCQLLTDAGDQIMHQLREWQRRRLAMSG
jgi:hypothetical protein